MDEPSSGDKRSCSPQSFVSTGTAEIKSMTRLTPTIRHLPKPMTSAEILESHTLPFPDISDSKSMREITNGQVLERDFASPPKSPTGQQSSELRNGVMQEETLQHEKTSEPGQDVESSKRRSIIDPTSVRLSFAGSITSLETPLLLEEGLQKLYRLYEQTTTEEACLPYSVSITEVPLITIADRLEDQLRDQHAALEQCCDSLVDLNNSISLARHDLKNLEFHYSRAREEANVHSMTPDEARLRLKWLREELVRVYNDKECILQQSRESADETHQLREKLSDMKKTQEENHHLRQSNARFQLRHEEMQKELGKVNKKLKALQGTLQSTPSLLRKLCTLTMVSSEGGREKVKPRNHQRQGSRISFY